MGVMESRACRPGRDTEDLGDLGRGVALVVMEHEQRPLFGRQPPEPAFELVPVGEGEQVIGRGRSVDRQHPQVRGPTPLARRLVAVVTLLLALALIAVLTLRAFGVPIAMGPDAVATPTPGTTSSPGATSAETPSPDQVLAKIESEVADLRDLAPADIGPPELISRDELDRRLTQRFEQDYPPEAAAADNVLLQGLGLLTADEDVATLQLQLLTGGVLGYYDPDAQAMVVVTDAGLTPEAQVTYAHEYTHALQDGAFGMDTLDLQRRGDDDGALAGLSLVEGDATTSMVLWAIDNLSPEEVLGISQTPLPDTTGVPAWMIRQQEFPYLAGTDFTSRLYATGGFGAVDEAWADPPISTEQILHPEKYWDEAARDLPRRVTIPDLSKQLGAGWSLASRGTLGELGLASLTGAPPLDLASPEVLQPARWTSGAAAGIGGDLYHHYVNGARSVTVLATVWDTERDAVEFQDGIVTLPRKRSFRFGNAVVVMGGVDLGPEGDVLAGEVLSSVATTTSRP